MGEGKVGGVTPEQVKKLQEGGWEDAGWHAPAWRRGLGSGYYAAEQKITWEGEGLWNADPDSEDDADPGLDFDSLDAAIEQAEEWRDETPFTTSGTATAQTDKFN